MKKLSPLKPAMGHFFGEDLLCVGCRVDYYDHQTLPSPCTIRVSFGNKGRAKGMTWLVRFGKHYKINFETIAARAGIPKDRMAKVSTGKTTGLERRAVWRALVALVREKQ